MTLREAIEGVKLEYNLTDAMWRVIAAAESTLPKAPPKNCVRVRIAVAVGYYSKADPSQGLLVGACGIDECDDEGDAMETAADKVADSPGGIIAQAFVEADIPRLPVVRGLIAQAGAEPSGVIEREGA